jgi:hypothetical protein
MGSSRDISDEVNKKQTEDKDVAAVRRIVVSFLGEGALGHDASLRSACATAIVEYFNAGPGGGYVNQD